MEGYYDVTLNDQKVGQVTVSKEGLYYKFSCSVKLPENSRYRLAACCERGAIDLGVCIPTLCTKIPIKRFKKEKYRFILSEKKQNQGTPVDKHQPFPCLNMLPYARFYMVNGKGFIIFNPKSPSMA